MQFLFVCFGFSGEAVGQEASKIKATVIDREGRRHEVSKFSFQQRTELEFYAGSLRRIEPFAKMERFIFQGTRGGEEQSVTVFYRTGKTETGKILTGGNALSQTPDSYGRSSTGIAFSGTKSLGPFVIRLNDVREVIFRYPEGQDEVLEADRKAIVIVADGKRFDVDEFRFLGREKFEFAQRGVRRSVPFARIDRIDLEVSDAIEERRPVTIRLNSGLALQGSVSISSFRLPGETDSSFNARLNRGFTGKTELGGFSIGLRDVKQIRFERAVEEPSESDG